MILGLLVFGLEVSDIFTSRCAELIEAANYENTIQSTYGDTQQRG